MGTTTVKSFIKEFIAHVKGDEVAAKAEKVFRQAESALKSHIASLQGDTIGLEDKVKEAEENAKKSLINFGETIVDRADYVSNLLKKENAAISAKEEHASHLLNVKFLEDKLKSLYEEVEEEAKA